MSHVDLLRHAKRLVRVRAAEIFAWILGSREFAPHQRACVRVCVSSVCTH